MSAEFTAQAQVLPVIETDVLVVGAGTAGCIAAIAAARAGADVTLIEKLPVPGGTLTNGGIGVSSYFSQHEDPSQAVRVVGGLPYELIRRLQDIGGATVFTPTPGSSQNNTYRVVAEHEIYKGIISEMLTEAGVHVLLNSMLSEVISENGCVKEVVVQTRAGRRCYRAKACIDTTGDGDLAKKAGAQQIDMTHGQECATGMVFGIGGIDFERALQENPTVMHKMAHANAEGKALSCDQYILALMADPEKCGPMKSLKGVPFLTIQSNHPGEATYVNLSRGEIIDGTDPEELSAAEMRMRARLVHIIDDLKTYIPGFENAYLSWASVQLGVRISYITKCDYSISQEEIHNAARFEDEIGLYAFHDLSTRAGDDILTVAPGFYGFPYRMLLPQGLENLFIAGRCVTEEYKAHMSTRNTVGAMLMGQGAGVAAALCAAKNCTSRELPYEELRAELLKQDVILDV